MKSLFRIFVIISCFISCAQQKAEDSIRLIPDGYIGPVVIIFNQKDGEPKEYEGKKRIYRIPMSGVLKTQFSENYGVQSHQFFYVNSDGSRTKIPYTDLKHDISDKKKDIIYAFAEEASNGGNGFDPNIGKYKLSASRTFYIDHLSDVEKAFRYKQKFELESQIQNIREKLGNVPE